MATKKGWNPDGYDPFEHNRDHVRWGGVRRRLSKGKNRRGYGYRGRAFWLKQRDAERILTRINNGETEDRYIYPSARWLRKFRRSNVKGVR